MTPNLSSEIPSISAPLPAEESNLTVWHQPRDHRIVAATSERVRSVTSESEDHVRPAWGMFTIAVVAFVYAFFQSRDVITWSG